MADRGRLFYDSNGKLRQVDPAFVINGEPTESDLEPIEIRSAIIEVLNTADVAAATEGHALTKGASGTDLEFEAVGGGATELIEAQSPTGVTSATFTTGIDGDHDTYIFQLSNVIPANDAQDLYVRTTTDGGANWDSGASDYAAQRQTIRGGAAEDTGGSETNSEIQLNTVAIGSAAGESGLSGTLYMTSPNDSGLKTYFHGTGRYISSAGNGVTVYFGGHRNTAEDNDGVRFSFPSGNIESGTIELLGVN